jgi:transposase
MSDLMEELAGRLVVGRKRDGRAVYDEQAKAELVAACRLPGASVSSLARSCGVNANQLSRWLREDGERHRHGRAAGAETAAAVFVPITVDAARAAGATSTIALQARLPNGVMVDLQCSDHEQAGRMIEFLGRLRCSASTNG